MIDQALSFITKELNQFVKQKLDIDHAIVELSGIPATHSLAKLHVTLVSLEEESYIKNQQSMGYGKQGLSKREAPLYINLHFLVSVSHNTPYVEGLKYLSIAMQFFQRCPIISRPTYVLPEGINKLTFELYNLNFEDQQNLWKSLGTSYQPSVLYKTRMLEIDGVGQKKIPQIKESSLNVVNDETKPN